MKAQSFLFDFKARIASQSRTQVLGNAQQEVPMTPLGIDAQSYDRG